jgi:nucleotide-binding universal stress UspA family protein
MRDHEPSQSVIVGIDGSRSALGAALWAVDEAVERDIPLRLVYAIEPRPNGDNQQAAHDLASAEIAVRHAFTVVESTDKPVKIEVEIMQSAPIPVLEESSRHAAMVCLGSVGLGSGPDSHVGSVAAALASTAHCPVSIVQGYDAHLSAQRWIVAEIDEREASDAVLRRGLDEARLRGAPLRVLTSWRSRFTDIHDHDAVCAGNRRVKAQIEGRLTRWRRRYPDLDIKSVAVHGSILNYLARNAATIQMLVIGHERAHGIREIIGPPGSAALHKAGCSVLVCTAQTVL